MKKNRKKSRPGYYYDQSAVIPFLRRNGKIKILLITNRKRRKWIFPKGIIETDMSPAASAAKEAGEEAGITGAVYEECAGSYRYKKWGGVCTVQVFPMRIEKVLQNWPESDIRDRIWVGVEEAKFFLDLPQIEEIIHRAAPLIYANGKLHRNSVRCCDRERIEKEGAYHVGKN